MLLGINNTLIENICVFVLKYNLFEYTVNYSMTGGLWNYYRDKIGNVTDNASEGKSLQHETKIIEKTLAQLDADAQLDV